MRFYVGSSPYFPNFFMAMDWRVFAPCQPGSTLPGHRDLTHQAMPAGLVVVWWFISWENLGKLDENWMIWYPGYGTPLKFRCGYEVNLCKPEIGMLGWDVRKSEQQRLQIVLSVSEDIDFTIVGVWPQRPGMFHQSHRGLGLAALVDSRAGSKQCPNKWIHTYIYTNYTANHGNCAGFASLIFWSVQSQESLHIEIGHIYAASGNFHNFAHDLWPLVGQIKPYFSRSP